MGMGSFFSSLWRGSGDRRGEAKGNKRES